jgi:hypothetical protein
LPNVVAAMTELLPPPTYISVSGKKCFVKFFVIISRVLLKDNNPGLTERYNPSELKWIKT